MADDAAYYIASGLSGLISGFAAGSEEKRKRLAEKRKIDLFERTANAKLAEDGFEPDPNNPIAVRPNEAYYTPDTPLFKQGNRASELARLKSPSAKAQTEDLSYLYGNDALKDLNIGPEGLKNLPTSSTLSDIVKSRLKPQTTHPSMKNKDFFSMRGEQLPPGVDPEGEISSSFINAIPQAPKPQPTTKYGTVRGLIDGTLPPETDVPTSIVSLAKPQKPGPVMPSKSDLRAYKATTGRDATGLSKSQLETNLNQIRNQGRLGDQFDKGFDEGKHKDLETRVEKIKADYVKTGIPAALPAFRVIDKHTGLFSTNKPDLSKVPSYGTNTIRAIPLVGDSVAAMASKKYGGQEVNQALQQLLNTDMRTTSGTAVTKWEMGRNMVAHGMGIGGSSKDVAMGLKMMHEGMLEADKSARVADPAVTNAWQQWGGQPPLDTMFRKKTIPEVGAPGVQRTASDDRADSAKRLGINSRLLPGIANPTDPKANAAAQEEIRKHDERARYKAWKKAGKPKVGKK